MSPRRRVARPSAKRRDLRGALATVGVVFGVAGVTALALWLIRPGGAASNQPRIATVLAGSLAVFIAGVLITRTPDRRVAGRLGYWTVVAVIVAIAISAGALLQALAGWSWALPAGIWIAAIVVGLSVLGELLFLMRRFSQGSAMLGIVLSLALALLLGAAGALAWPGGIRIERAPSVPIVPTTPIPPTSPSAGQPPASLPPISSSTGQ
ncbi:MAG: hypothetical protein ACOYN3_07835 [Acidimicrobiia bacterium]